jgi:hypothetical protein
MSAQAGNVATRQQVTYRVADCDTPRACATARCRPSTAAPVSSNPGDAGAKGEQQCELKNSTRSLFSARRGPLTLRASQSKRIERLRPHAVRVARCQHQQPPLSLASNEHKAILRRGFGLPALTSRRAIAAAMAPDKSAADSRRWHSITCHCRSQTTT